MQHSGGRSIMRLAPNATAVLMLLVSACGNDNGTSSPGNPMATGGWQPSAGGGAGTIGGGGVPGNGGVMLAAGSGGTAGPMSGSPSVGGFSTMMGSGGAMAVGGMTGISGTPSVGGSSTMTGSGGAMAAGGMTGMGGSLSMGGDGGLPGDGGSPSMGGDGGSPSTGGGGGAPPVDGCTDTLVTGLSLTALDAYQTVQIRIMEERAGVGRNARNADIVAGRQTVLRVHVTTEAGWSPREVAARIELETSAPSGTQVFSAALTPTGASNDGELASTFQVRVPPEAIAPDTRYSVTLVECDGAPAGAPVADPARARFPTAGFEELAAVETGPLKIHIIPISGTDISQEGLDPFKQRVEAVYPITEVEFTIGEPLTSFAGSMCSLLASVSSRRSQDGPPNDVYYYGLAPGILGGQSGCSNTNPSARGSKVSAGWAQGYRPDDGRTGAATMCHELGHAHGRFHAPCNVQDPDRSYPYPGADIGVWGYDRRSDEFLEPTRKDMMSYCPEPRWAAWISDYTYQEILERTIEVNAQTELPTAFDAHGDVSWRLLVSDSAGIHWVEQPLLGTPEGEPISAVVHGAQGPMQQVEVYRQWLEDGVTDGAFMLSVPQREPGWRAIEVPGLLKPQAL